MTVECTQFSTSKAIGKNAITRVNYRRTRVRNFPRFTRNSIFPFSICTYFPPDESFLLKTKSFCDLRNRTAVYVRIHVEFSGRNTFKLPLNRRSSSAVGPYSLVATAGYGGFFFFFVLSSEQRRRLCCRNLRVIDGRLSDDRNNSICVRFSTFPGEKCFARVTIFLVGTDVVFKRNCQFRRHFVGSRKPNKKRVQSVFVVLTQLSGKKHENRTNTPRIQRTNTN